MGIDLSLNIKPSDAKRFNTKEILLHFINLLNPEKFKTLDDPNADAETKELRAKLAAASNALAQMGKDLNNPLPKIVEILRTHLGTPAKGSKRIEVLSRLTTFENNYLPNLTIQHEELKKAREALRGQFDILVSQGDTLDLTRVENLKAEIDKFKANKVQPFVDQKAALLEKTEGFKVEVIGSTGKTPSMEIPDEAPAPGTTQAPQNK